MGIVAIDIGSNSLRAVRLQCLNLEIEERMEWIVGSGWGVDGGGAISPEVFKKVGTILCNIKERYPKDPKVAVATAAFRKARNGKESIEELQALCGFLIEIISPELESYYSAQGVAFGLERVGLDPQKFLLVDIGGGSTEIILKHRQELVTKSFDLGILSVAERYRSREEIHFGIKRKMGEIREYCHDIFEFFGKPKLFVGTGGTPTTVAALKLGLEYRTYDPLKVDGTRIDRNDIARAYKELLALSKEERARLVGTGREEAILAGLVLLEELFEKCGYAQMVVVDEGVREGLAIEECRRMERILTTI
ncbi:MAG: hypothetical protein GXO19_00655 [Epsilonproteobacteria bacterium]|nr:hypothetical protein [Campylobacterota bacterium]NPA56223.1 hypothetical protein [Campylobacterota bacterium]